MVKGMECIFPTEGVEAKRKKYQPEVLQSCQGKYWGRIKKLWVKEYRNILLIVQQSILLNGYAEEATK